MKTIRKLALGLVVAGTALLPFAAIAYADPPAPVDPVPGAECSHGINDDGTCRPDPNEAGQDCDEHGVPNPAGNDGNEDHCIIVPTTTTVVPTTTTTTTTAPPVVTTTTTTTVSTIPPTTVTNTTSVAPAPGGHNGGGGGGGNEPTVAGKQVEPAGKLAYTGIEDVVPIGSLALALLTGGSGLMWLGRKKEQA